MATPLDRLDLARLCFSLYNTNISHFCLGFIFFEYLYHLPYTVVIKNISGVCKINIFQNFFYNCDLLEKLRNVVHKIAFD